jgi:hypothetical protein
MTSTKKWFTGFVAVISVTYKLAEHMEFMRPVVTWLDKRFGGDTLIELLLSALVVYLLVTHGEREETASESAKAQPPAPSPIQSPVQTVSPEIKVDASQHHHYGEPVKKAPALKQIPVRRKPSIVGKKSRIARLNTFGDGVVFVESEDKGKFVAVVAEFRNEPGGFSIINWHHVRASIIYYDEHGTEVADVGRAVWMEGLTYVDMESHVTFKLIVAIFADKWLSFNGEKASPLPLDTKRAKITLQDDREFYLPFVLDFDLNLGTVGSLTPLTPPE